MFRIFSFRILIIICFILICGCSGRGPVENEIKVLPPGDDAFPLLIPEGSDGSSQTARGLLGAFRLHAEIDGPSVELSPLRTASKKGDSFLNDIFPYFTSVPCKDCLSISNVGLDDGNRMILTFRIKHPFEQGDPSQPPTGKNRDDLRIFDVKLIVAAEGETEFSRSGVIVNPDVVYNADGYTSLEDPIVDFSNDIDTNLFPYIILAEDPTNGNVDPSSPTGFADLSLATGHNVLNQGQTYYSDLAMYFKYGGVINANLFMFGSWGQATANYLERLTPQYWLPEFNLKEPWKVNVEVQNNTLNNALATTSADVVVKVWDWQHSTVKIDPNLTDLDSIKASSAISGITVDIPGLNQPVDTAITPTSGNGLDTTPLEYRVTVQNDRLAATGTYYGLVEVTDSREGGLNYGSMGELVDYDPLEGLTFIKIDEFKTYQVFTIDVAEAGGPACGPINASLQYGRPGDMFMFPLPDREFHMMDGEEWKFKVAPSCPNGQITNISFDFDDPGFTDQSGVENIIQRVFDNPNCAAHDPFELHMTITVTDDCAASADWIDVLTIYIHCGDFCGPIDPGTFTYSVNGGTFDPFPATGITIQHNDELVVKANGFTSQNATITKYTYDFDDPEIEDQSLNSASVTRVIAHPACTSGGAEPYVILLDVTVADNCKISGDYEKQLQITVECPAECGPIGGGLLEYSQEGSPFSLLAGNILGIVTDTEIAFRLNNFTSPNANITTYTFTFDDPAYQMQSGTDNTVTNSYVNPDCVAGEGPTHFITMTYRISDDCPSSQDLVGSVLIKVFCSPCNGAGLNFSGVHRVLASGTVFKNLDITKLQGKGMKPSDGGGGNLYAGYIATRNSDSQTGIGMCRSSDNGNSWPLCQFIPTPVAASGFSVITANGFTIIVAWFDSATDKIYVERSINGGVIFTRSEVYDSDMDIYSLSLGQDPLDPTRICIVFIENENTSGDENRIRILRSEDAGETFPPAFTKTVIRSIQAYDRPFTATDVVVSPYNSNVYVCAAQNDSAGSNILVARSNNSGADFNAGARILSQTSGTSIDTLDIACTLADPDKQAVYIVFTQGAERKGQVKLARGAITSESFAMVNTTIADSTNKRPREASCVVDKQGNVYVAWQEDRSTVNSPDIYADYSRDRGVTFGEDRIVNDSAPGAANRTSPEIIISESDCEIVVVYEDDSENPNGEIFTRIG